MREIDCHDAVSKDCHCKTMKEEEDEDDQNSLNL